MKNTTSFKRLVAACAVSVVAVLTTSMAQAAEVVTCAVPKVGTHQYQTSGAIDCVWGQGQNTNIGQGNEAQDDFLNGSGKNDGDNSFLASTFGLTGWKMIGSELPNSQGNFDVNAADGLFGELTVSNYDSDSFTWVLNASGYSNYALGLKDGADPKWAVFLLSGSRTGDAAIVNGNGGWSHFVLYGTKDGSPPPEEFNTPEPGTLALVGLALLGATALRRRRA